MTQTINSLTLAKYSCNTVDYIVMNTSSNRVDSLIALSDRIYDVIDAPMNEGTRARKILTVGINAVAHSLEKSYGHRFAGDGFHAFLLRELEQGGLTTESPAYAPWPAYQSTVSELPGATLHGTNEELFKLASSYADVRRLTLARDGTYETDASHAVHLAALALPYAAEYYPELDQAKIALYCLLHDIVEAYAGDVPTLGASDEMLRLKDIEERAALERIVYEFTPHFPKLVSIIQSYEHLSDNEARFVKSFDKLDPSFTHLANRGLALTRECGIRSSNEFLRQTDITTARIARYANDFPEVIADRTELLERVAAQTDWPQ